MALFSRSKKGVVGLDIGSSAVKLVELSERKAGELVFTPAGEEHSDVIHGRGAHA